MNTTGKDTAAKLAATQQQAAKQMPTPRNATRNESWRAGPVDQRNANRVAERVVRGIQKAAAQQQTRERTATRLAEHERQTKDICVVPAMRILDRGNP